MCMDDRTTASEQEPKPAGMLVVPPMLCQRVCEKLKIELPSVAEGDSRMLRPQMITDVQNLTLRAITDPSELPGDHGNVVPAVLDQFARQASFITCRAVTAYKRAQRWVNRLSLTVWV
jgi:hypothetical protein